ncbi:hypothetical protein A323_gp20 [Acinetobacter phage AP22]|uniref:Uncharacterized protein n=2 Tax=Obolenskvirus TaxID=1915205 RepID=I2GUC7_9CAUD|nr:hypothetical protein A323_gp20 [Acinetobacter phage AP22]CCH57728.1 hypothetical protein [Acinetobacter phage AP22]
MMINVVYLVMVFGGSSANTASVLIPQANMAQCQANLKGYGKAGKVTNAYCIVGVMLK